MDVQSHEEPAGTDPAIHLALVERCAITRHALRLTCVSLLHVQPVSEASGISEACRTLDLRGRAVVLLGPSISVDECLGLQTDITLSYPSSSIITIQMQLLPDRALQLVQQGVIGILDEQASEQDLVLALAVVAAGQPFISRPVRALLAAIQATPQGAQFTRREREVLALLMHGESNDGIGRQLGVARKTVEMHVSHIYGKLGVCSRTQAILRAQELALVESAALPTTRSSSRSSSR